MNMSYSLRHFTYLVVAKNLVRRKGRTENKQEEMKKKENAMMLSFVFWPLTGGGVQL